MPPEGLLQRLTQHGPFGRLYHSVAKTLLILVGQFDVQQVQVDLETVVVSIIFVDLLMGLQAGFEVKQLFSALGVAFDENRTKRSGKIRIVKEVWPAHVEEGPRSGRRLQAPVTKLALRYGLSGG